MSLYHVDLILVTLGSLSLLGSLFIVLTWACMKALRTSSTLMIACLAGSDFLYVHNPCIQQHVPSFSFLTLRLLCLSAGL